MMIAFYFGSRSLEFLKGKTGSSPALSSDQNSSEVSSDLSSDKTIYTDKPDSDQKPEEAPKIKVAVAGNVTTIPMITQVKDPMAFNE